MSNKIVYLFPDTNIFLQCRALAEIDWSAWSGFDEVHLVVTRPVLREIDNLKNKGRDRAARRARDTNSLFGELIRGGKDHKIVRADKPCVKLFLKPEYNPSPTLKDRLDYQERDEQLGGNPLQLPRKESRRGCAPANGRRDPHVDSSLAGHQHG